MSRLGKSLIAATSRRNAPARLGDPEAYKFGVHDVDLGDVLESLYTIGGIPKTATKYRLGTRYMAINYNSSGLKYYITWVHTQFSGSTSNSSYDKLDCVHLTLTEPHDLNTIDHDQTVYKSIDFDDVDATLANGFSLNDGYGSFNWANGGYKFNVFVRTTSSIVTQKFNVYTLTAQTPYDPTTFYPGTQLGTSNFQLAENKQDFQSSTQIHWDLTGTNALLTARGSPFLSYSTTSSNAYNFDGGGSGSQWPIPNAAWYSPALSARSSSYASDTTSRVWVGTVNSTYDDVFYPTRSSVNNDATLILEKNRTTKASNRTWFTKYGLTPTSYNCGDIDASQPNITSVRDFGFSLDGTKLYQLGSSVSNSYSGPVYLQQANLSTPFDPSTATSYTSLDIATVINPTSASASTFACSFCFNLANTYAGTTAYAAGKRLFILGIDLNENVKLYTLNLSTAWDVSTATLDEALAENVTGITGNDIVAADSTAIFRSQIFMHPNRQNASSQNIEAVCIMPYCGPNNDKMNTWLLENNGGGSWTSIYVGNLQDFIEQDANSIGGSTTYNAFQDIAEKSYNYPTLNMHDFGQNFHDTSQTKYGVRREAYYRFLQTVDITYGSGASGADIINVENCSTGHGEIQQRPATRSSGTGNFAEAVYVGELVRTVSAVYGTTQNDRMYMPCILEEAASPNDNTIQHYACYNRYRMGGVDDFNIGSGQIATNHHYTPPTNGQIIEGVPIGEIFSGRGAYSINKKPGIFMHPLRAATAELPELNARIGFIDDRGYVQYLESDYYSDNGQYPLPTVLNEPRGVNATMGLGLKYLKTENTISAHDIFMDDQTFYASQARYQRIKDVEFDLTGHVCLVLTGSMGATSGDWADSVWVYFVTKPFSTNKNDWTYVGKSTHAGAGNRPDSMSIFRDRVIFTDTDADVLYYESIDISDVRRLGPNATIPATWMTSPSQDRQSLANNTENIQVSHNENLDGSYDALWTYKTSGTTFLYKSTIVYNPTYTRWEKGTSSPALFVGASETGTHLSDDVFSTYAWWYDWDKDILYFAQANEDASSTYRNPLTISRVPLLTKTGGVVNNSWEFNYDAIETFDHRGTVNVAPHRIKVHRDRLIFVDYEKLYIGSVRLK